jgi:potassium channel subfamily K protein
VVSEAVGAGVSVVDQNFTVSWDFIQSVFFSTTILTTIGYGNISPVTFPGRLFCILFAIIGIPFTLSVIADIGQILATIISKLWDQYKLKIKPLLEKHNILKKPSE